MAENIVPIANRSILTTFFEVASFHKLDPSRDRQGILYEAVLLNRLFESYSLIRVRQCDMAKRLLLSSHAAPTPDGIDAFLRDEGRSFAQLQGHDLYGLLANGVLLGVAGAYPATPPYTFCKAAEAPKALELRASRWVRALCDLSLSREAAFLANRPAVPVFDEYLDVASGRETIARDALAFVRCLRTVVEQVGGAVPDYAN